MLLLDNIITLKSVSKTYGEHHVLCNINLGVRNGEFLTIVGPSGCGKTTLLRLISGFETPSTGHVYFGDKNVTSWQPQQRPVNTVFQSYALFPHLTVFENVAFGLRCQALAKNEIEPRVKEALGIVKLAGLSQRKPNQLSGGQQQRVAIARAIVNRPLVLLLDEPLSSLDYRLRKAMQLELKQLQRKLGITFIFVTHDQEEALTMADRIVVMHEGEIQQIGTPREVYEEPINLTVANFIGELNIFDSYVSAKDEKFIYADIAGKRCRLENKKNFNIHDEIHILVRPEDVRIWRGSEVTDTSDMFSATIDELTYKGSTVDFILRLPSGKTLAATEFFNEDDESLEYNIGETVWLKWYPGWEVILPYEKE